MVDAKIRAARTQTDLRSGVKSARAERYGAEATENGSKMATPSSKFNDRSGAWLGKCMFLYSSGRHEAYECMGERTNERTSGRMLISDHLSMG